MSSRPPIDGRSRPRPLEVAIVGNDLLLAALPARPVQLSHAILACGYDHVVPVSWGEEIVAEHALRALAWRTPAPVIVSACARARDRLLVAGPELEDRLLAFVSPAVATARYVRALQPTARLRITYIGACDTRGDVAINAIISPETMLRRLAERGISAVRQPAVFESIIPPDRRRHFSRPGGAPGPEAIASRAPEWRVVTIEEEGFSVALAELLLSGERLVIDVAPRLGCPCCSGLAEEAEVSGALEVRPAIRLAELEPPHSPSPVVDHEIAVSVESPPRRPRVASAERTPPAFELARGDSPRDVVAPSRTATVHAIEGARQRAARRHIAVTPSNVALIAARSTSASVASILATPVAAPVAATVVPLRPIHARSDEVRAPDDASLAPRQMVSHRPETETPIAIELARSADTTPSLHAEHAVPGTAGVARNDTPEIVTRRRTPAHAAFHVARVAALARAGREGAGGPVRTFASRRYTPASVAVVVEEDRAPASAEAPPASAEAPPATNDSAADASPREVGPPRAIVAAPDRPVWQTGSPSRSRADARPPRPVLAVVVTVVATIVALTAIAFAIALVVTRNPAAP